VRMLEDINQTADAEQKLYTIYYCDVLFYVSSV